DITFPLMSPFTYIAQSGPTGNNWTLTAYDPDGFELDLTFSTTTPGSLVGFTGGTIVSGQVLDPEGGFNIFEGFSGTISPSPTSGSPATRAVFADAAGFGFPFVRVCTNEGH